MRSQKLHEHLRVHIRLLPKGNANHAWPHIDAAHAHQAAQSLKRSQTPQHLHLCWQLTKAVYNLIQQIVALRILHLRQATIDFHLIARVSNIIIGNIRLRRNLQNRLRLGHSHLTILQTVDGLLQHLAISCKANAHNMPVLLTAEEIARAANFQIAHGNLKAGTQLRKIANRLQALFCDFAQRLIWLVHKVSVG